MLYDPSTTVSLKSLNAPSCAKAITSSTKELEGVLGKKGEVVKSWKQRCVVIFSSLQGEEGEKEREKEKKKKKKEEKEKKT
jgi:hypothetical protein